MNDRVKKDTPNVAPPTTEVGVGDVKASGTIRIISKDGKLKAVLPITSIQRNEDKDNATKHNSS